MPTPDLSEDEHRLRKEAVESALRDGYDPFRQSLGGKGSSVKEAARRAERSVGAVEHWVRRQITLKQQGKPNHCPDWSLFAGPETPEIQKSAPEERREIRDAGFWRRKAKGLEKDLADAEHLAEELAGVRNVPITIPDWLLDTRVGKRGKSVIGALVSDIHMGEVIDPDEINNLNAFNPDICRARMQRYFEAVCIIGQRWASDTDCEGALLTLGGDLISGDIHDELRVTNALTAHEQVAAAVEVCGAGIKLLKETYGAVHVIGVPGNHGRTTAKPTAKLYSRLSYDTLCMSMLAEQFKDDARITFQFGRSVDQITPIFGRTLFTSHGDQMGTKGGMGFAGPVLPIVRGTKKVEAQQAQAGQRPDLIQHGHYHTTANPGMVLSNGSVPGYSEYARGLRASLEPPQQWAYLLHSKWWLRERAPIRLEEPAPVEKPRVRMPAGMA